MEKRVGDVENIERGREVLLGCRGCGEVSFDEGHCQKCGGPFGIRRDSEKVALIPFGNKIAFLQNFELR